jgi:predicted glycogen debranching enzyme
MGDERVDLADEWLEPDCRGGFASGTVGGERTRRYHALLLTAVTPPTGRLVLVNGLEAWIESGTTKYPLSTQRYAPNVIYPDGNIQLSAYTRDPWPIWTFRLPDGTVVKQDIFVPTGTRETVLRWRRSSCVGRCGCSCPAGTITRCTMKMAISGSTQQVTRAMSAGSPISRFPQWSR